jgi:hypothetical protein
MPRGSTPRARLISSKGNSFFPQKINRNNIPSDVTGRVKDARQPCLACLVPSVLRPTSPVGLCAMDLRRLAQANAMASPRRLSHPSNHRTTAPTTPTPAPALPTTPRTRASYPITRSPLESPSISASLPFDWDAARGLRSPPYSTFGPRRRGARKSELDSPSGKGTPSKRAVRRQSLYEK